MPAEKMEKGKVCGPCMCTLCGSIMGILVLLAGLVFLLNGLGMVVTSAMLANEVGGALLLLYGLGMLVHALGLCPMCK